MKARATAANGLVQTIAGNSKIEIIESAKSMALHNSCGVELVYDDGGYNYINFESSPNGEGGKSWEITVE